MHSERHCRTLHGGASAASARIITDIMSFSYNCTGVYRIFIQPLFMESRGVVMLGGERGGVSGASRCRQALVGLAVTLSRVVVCGVGVASEPTPPATSSIAQPANQVSSMDI